jgi:hypothetical protein
MIGLILAIILFNLIAFKNHERLSANQVVHIYSFTIAFQSIFDVIIEFKYHGYWYFTKNVEWVDVLPHTLLIPPINILFLNWYPFRAKLIKQIMYFAIWIVAILGYERLTLIPNPWGYFHYGWWKMWHAVLIDPILFGILLGYYKWICKLENRGSANLTKG